MKDELKFLVVEDDPTDAKAVCRILSRSGLSNNSDSASSLGQAKEKIRHHQYDAVILDLGLPDSQGIDGVIDFQATAPELPIVVLTGCDDEKTALRSMNIGAEDFINKNTMTDERLCRSLRYAIERHRRKREVYHDIDTLRLSLNDAMQQANTDTLTGLPNRRGLQRYLDQFSQAGPRQPFVVGVADLDHFKTINDEHGHNVGDTVLKEFAARLQHCLRSTDFAARVGGDEFVIVFGALNRNEAVALGQRMLRHVSSSPAEDAGKKIPFSATLAMAEMDPNFADLEQILAQTHVLLAKGKGGGRNQVQFAWDEDPSAAPLRSAATGADPEPGFSEASLQLLPRVVNTFSVSGSLGYHLIFGLGPASWPMAAPALSRARLANRLSHMTLNCMMHAYEWRQAEAPGCELHLDIEADAIKPWVCTEMTRIFSKESERASCILFLHTDFPDQPGAASLSDLRLLRQAGFQIGVRNVGDGATILEHLQLLEPDWIRFDPALTINAGRYEKKAAALARMVEMLRPLDAGLLADECGATEDLRILQDLGFHAYYAESPAAKAAAL